jgi:signal transduction histidine kinase/CHASE1-domain containing sensor protein/CheY-like chemotaxis protein
MPPLCKIETTVSKRARLSAILVLALSLAGCGVFLGYGINAARADADESFERRAVELIQTIESTWKEYEHIALSIHNVCRRSRNTTRKEFQEFYEYLLAAGLEFESAQCCPNVTHAERASYEAEALEFYSEYYPSVDYNGFIGFIPDDETGQLIVVPSPELPFYFPVHYLEPVLPNQPAIELDLYSFPSQKNEIDLAVASREPVLSTRLHTVQETEENAYSVIIYHPGIFLETEPDEYPSELSLVLIRIPSLLSRVALVQEENLAVYLYDTTIMNTGGAAEFLGGGAFKISGKGEEVTHALELLPEIAIDTLHNKFESSRVYEETVAITPSGTWVVAVVPVDDTYKPYFAYVLFGGAMILTAGVCIAAWYFTNARRDARLNEMRVASEAEKATLIVENAENAALAERELNDFLAHEVRNPLAAAMSACSFVSSAIDEDKSLATLETATLVKEDVGIINTSLQYINDLLRNMLDMHKAHSDQLGISLSPACLRKDVLEPVATMLYQRGDSFKVIVECPENLFILTDRIRLKQIVLNLANNSRKFVQTGFVRIRADVVDDKVHVYVEDSGPGIPMDKRDTLFEKFQTSLDILNQGTGIGLSLCKDLTELLNGGISLDEDFHSGIEGCPGARFIIDLNTPPLHLEELPLDDSRDYHGSSSLKNLLPKASSCLEKLPEELKVLFVDDDVVLRKLFSRSLKRVAPGWNVQEAANGETAIHLIEESKSDYDLIFIDQYMASIQKQLLGTECVRAMRAKGFKGLICGLSANAMEDTFISAGADAFMIKPFPCEKEQLKKELCRVLFGDGVPPSADISPEQSRPRGVSELDLNDSLK